MNRRLIKNFIAALLVVSTAPAVQAVTLTVTADDLNEVSQSFNAWTIAGVDYLYDPSFSIESAAEDPLDASGIEPLGDTVIYDARWGDGISLYNVTRSAPEIWDPLAVSAISNIYRIDEYFRTKYGLNGLDGNEMNYLAIIHFDEDPTELDARLKNVNRAFWNGRFMVYSDGDATHSKFRSFAGCLDVAAHEMSHAVIEHTANFRDENQSGALKESFADIFAVMIDTDNWTIGEKCAVQTNYFLRSLESPSAGNPAQIHHMDNYKNKAIDDDFGGVRVNSGIPNRVAYLLAEGLSAEGLGVSIGREETEQIFYLALTRLESTAVFADALCETVKAADDLYGVSSTESAAVTLAWAEVGVQVDDCATFDSPQPSNAVIVAGDDELLYLKTTTGGFSLHQQNLTNPSDIALTNTVLAANSRPTLVTVENVISGGPTYSQYVYYVGSDENIYRMDLAQTGESKLTSTDNIKSVAVSPDHKYLAFVTTDSPSAISVMNVDSNVSSAVVYSLLRDDLINVAEVGSLAFDFSGSKIVFDVAYCQSLPGDLCVDGDGYRYQSLAVLNLSTNHIEYPLPSQPINVEIAYPSFAYNNSYMLVMDRIDKTVPGSITSEVVTFNTVTQEMKTLVTLTSAAENWGVPSFWGGDDFVTYHKGGGAYKIPVNADGSLGSLAEEELNVDALMSVMHRKMVRDVSPLLEPSISSLDFGEVLLDDNKDLTLQIINSGPVDVQIKDISSPNYVFSHNGINALLPRGESMELTVRFQAETTLGKIVDTLSISYGNGEMLELEMKVTVVSAALLVTNVDVIEFGGVVFDTHESVFFRVTNNGTQEVVVTDVTVSNPAFSFDSTFVRLAVSGNNDGKNSRDIAAGYTAGSGPRSDQGTLTIHYNGGKTLSVALIARSIPAPTPALLEPDVTELNFGQVEAWSTNTLAVVLKNVGEVTAVISAYAPSGKQLFSSLSSDDEDVTEDTLNKVVGGAAVTVSVSYAANDLPGLKTGSLDIVYNDGLTLSIPVTVEVLAPEPEELGEGGFASLSLMPLFFMLMAVLIRYWRGRSFTFTY